MAMNNFLVSTMDTRSYLGDNIAVVQVSDSPPEENFKVGKHLYYC